MDIAENGIGAGASRIDITVTEDIKENRLTIGIKDNGRGIPPDLLDHVTDPFYTTRTTRRVGLGLSLFREAARRCEGDFRITSRQGEGTEVTASFRLDHIDLAPLGNMAGSLASLIMGNPHVDFVYTHKVDDKAFRLDTAEVKQELDGTEITHPKVIRFLGELIRESLADIRTE